VVIPAAFRAALGVEAGDELIMELDEMELRITTMKHRIDRARNRVRKYAKPGSSLVDELIAMRREAAKHE
jgi:bifunctional DNA-binding transcriptional regulator/antitoxin component of YhaV-PrlF toxin-antitoxin module